MVCRAGPNADTAAVVANEAGDKGKPSAVTVSIPVKRADATDLVTSTLIGMGYSIDQASAYTVSTMPGSLKDWKFVVHVAMVAAGDSTHVILTGSFHNALMASFVGGANGEKMGENQPIVAHAHGVQGMLWGRLNDLAAKLKAAR